MRNFKVRATLLHKYILSKEVEANDEREALIRAIQTSNQNEWKIENNLKTDTK